MTSLPAVKPEGVGGGDRNAPRGAGTIGDRNKARLDTCGTGGRVDKRTARGGKSRLGDGVILWVEYKIDDVSDIGSYVGWRVGQPIGTNLDGDVDGSSEEGGDGEDGKGRETHFE